MIVVGIDVPNRFKELYPKIENDEFGDFLKTELIPFLDSSYQTLPNRLFVGHSMSGLRGAHTAIFESNLFESFILIDPSLSEKDFEWYNRVQAQMNNFNPKNKKIFLAMAQTMPPSYPDDIESIKRDTTSRSTHMRAIIGFSEAMQEKNTENNEFFNWNFYPNETHYSVTHLALHDGLRYIYDYYYDFHYLYIYDDNTSANEALNRFKEYFRILGEKQNTKPFPIQEYFLMYDSGFERRGQTEKAKVFANYYLECYPQSDTAKFIVNKYK